MSKQHYTSSTSASQDYLAAAACAKPVASVDCYCWHLLSMHTPAGIPAASQLTRLTPKQQKHVAINHNTEQYGNLPAHLLLRRL
jgi:hypothetical protein